MNSLIHGFVQMLHELVIGSDKFIFIHGSTPEKGALDLSCCAVF
jgi:hypothetical protein